MTARPVALVQLVSEQTMPNVLAALALEPAHLTLLHTPRTKPHTGWIHQALRRAGLNPVLELRSFSPAPDIDESGARVRAACQEHVAAGRLPVVNITGGTKLMSIGAFAATIGPAWPALYVDTEHRRFLPVGKSPLPEPLNDGWSALQRAERRLNVDVVAAAHGCDHVSKGEDPAPFFALAEHLRTHPADEQACHRLVNALRTRGRPADLLGTLDQPLDDLPPAVVEPALAAGLLEMRSCRPHLACPTRSVIEQACRQRVPPADLYAATRPLQFAQGFLSGQWWELSVLHAARSSGAFRDLRWSVRFGTETDHLEEDIVALSGINLAVFSCKRGGERERLNRAFEEFVSAAMRIGGTFAERYFCVALPIAEKHFATVRSEAERTRTRLLGPAARISPAVFASA